MADQVRDDGFDYPQALPRPPVSLTVIMTEVEEGVVGQSQGEYPHGLRFLREGDVMMFIPWTSVWAIYITDELDADFPEGEEL